MTEASAATVRALIARLVLGDDAGVARLGSVRLRAHQRAAVARVRAALAEFRGALLADDVGLGKTYAALALAAEARHPLVVAPAGLRGMWRDALAATGVGAGFVSVESLGRGGGRPAGAEAPGAHDLVVIDEAHHLRNPSTRRYRAAAALVAGARVLLLSATPVHNRRGDLDALLALFLGSRARALGDDELARCVVRRGREQVGDASSPPRVTAPEWLPVGGDAGVLDELAALPPPLPPSDGGDGGALLAHALVRQWASSDGALRGALERRLARAAALDAALESGCYPSRAELRAWAYAGGVVQLAFPGLVSSAHDDAGGLLPAVRAHAEAARRLLRGLTGERDVERAARLREVRRRHPGEKLVAFSTFADTVDALFAELRAEPGVAALTAAGAVVAGGTLSRRDAITRFAPTASGVRPPAAAERIDLLLTTDLLSEGVNLQDASVVVHLDLPWTPARLEQRVGRVARIGSPHERVAVYALAPPASAERLLAVERRLREKASAAGRAIGIAGAILPGLSDVAGMPAPGPRSAPEMAEEIREQLARWLTGSWGIEAGGQARDEGRDDAMGAAAAGAPRPPRGTGSLVAAVRSETHGFVAAYDDGGACILVAACDGGEPSRDQRVVARAVLLAGGAPVRVDPATRERAMGAFARWDAGRRAHADAGLRDGASARARRRVIERIAGIVRRAAHHRRPAVAALARDARRAALLPCGAGGERVLDALAAADMADDAWLRAVGAFGETQACGAAGPADAPLRLRAMILFQP